MSHVWIAMDDEAYENNTIYAVCRTAEGAKAAITRHVAEHEAERAAAYGVPVAALTFDWRPDGPDGWEVMGRYTFYRVERHEVVEA